MKNILKIVTLNKVKLTKNLLYLRPRKKKHIFFIFKTKENIYLMLTLSPYNVKLDFFLLYSLKINT